MLADGGEASLAALALRKSIAVATRQGASLFALRSAFRLVGVAGRGDGDRDLLIAARSALPAESRLAEASAADASSGLGRTWLARLAPDRGRALATGQRIPPAEPTVGSGLQRPGAAR